MTQDAPKLTTSRGERIFRGMVGMGTIFGFVGVALLGTLGAISLVMGFDRDDMDFMIAGLFVGFGIAFGLGIMLAISAGKPEITRE